MVFGSNKNRVEKHNDDHQPVEKRALHDPTDHVPLCFDKRQRYLRTETIFEMENLCTNIIYFHVFSFFWFSCRILSDPLILPVSQLYTYQMMTSEIRSHIEYLILNK